jgi:deaminated glutathione amidase
MNDIEQRLPVVAAIQMVSSPNVLENLASAARLIGEAADAGANLVQLPEYFCIMGAKDTDKVAVREPFGDGPIQTALANLAAKHHLWILGGTLPLEAGSQTRVRNALLVFDPEGRQIGRYDKIHLFSFTNAEQSFDEARTNEPGNQPVALDLDVAGTTLRVGLSVCYDLRFPELYRALGACDLMVVPSAFTFVTGQAHWEVLLRARAIENQCYVLAAAQGGRHVTGRRTFGHSILIDPWGEVMGLLPEGEGIVSGVIDRSRILETRTRLPALAHRTL